MLVVFLSEFWFIEWSIIAQNDAFFYRFFYRFLQHPYSVEPASSRQSPFPVGDCLIYVQLYIIRRNSVLVTYESKRI